MSNLLGTPVSGRALVAHEPVDGQVNWTLENVTLRKLGPKELIVRIVATGICHTDIVFSTWPAEAIPFPKVLGHEGIRTNSTQIRYSIIDILIGSGYVEQVGAEVTAVKVGDSVLCSFQYCATCKDCSEGHPSFCQQFSNFNYGGDGDVFTFSGGVARGSFFGQSSFASYTVVKEASVVNVSGLLKDEEELKLLSPLGCGIQTGIGTIEKLAGATEKDSVVILGLGGVGLSAVLVSSLCLPRQPRFI